jgi:hypothetical protein
MNRISFLTRYIMVLLKPDDEDGSGSTDHDGSLTDAARVMPDIEALERASGDAPRMQDEGKPKATRERNTDGTFKVKAKDGDEAAAKAEADKDKEGDGKAAAETEDDEDYLELPPETEGAEPVRHKVSDVFAGYQRAQTLEAELTELKGKAATMAPEAEKAVEQLIEQMGYYQQAVQQFGAMQQGREPDLALLDDQSENYNPALYAQQKQMAERAKQASAAAKSELERVNREMTAHQEKLQKARFEREQNKLKEFWPELIGDETVQQKVQAAALKHFGITREDFSSIVDHRHYKVLKAALAHLEAEEKTAAAVKIVRAKPKLVKGSARSSTNAKDAQRAAAVGRLEKSGSLDDAADAIGGLLH